MAFWFTRNPIVPARFGLTLGVRIRLTLRVMTITVDPREDPASSSPNSGLEYSGGVDCKTLRWVVSLYAIHVLWVYPKLTVAHMRICLQLGVLDFGPQPSESQGQARAKGRLLKGCTLGASIITNGLAPYKYFKTCLKLMLVIAQACIVPLLL